MENTQTSETAVKTAPYRAVLERIAEPFAIFAGSLLVLLLLAQFLVLPLFNRFEVDGQALKPDQLAQYQARLTQEVKKEESDRDLLVLPVKNETYRVLQESKSAGPSLASVKSSILQIAKNTQGSGSVIIQHLDFDGATLTVKGDVRAGLSSMTVLAAFVEGVEALPFADAFVRPAFTREEDEGGPHSPFEFSFRLK